MTLRLSDKWIWDFWFAQDGGDTHVFYLQAPRALEKEELRHQNATVGHAVSQDLFDWQVLPDALLPGSAGSWDDLAIWTGSMIHHQGEWLFFYTAISRAEVGKVQRIGLATSPDLLHWSRYHDHPVIEADPRWYEQASQSPGGDQSWRDPWVFWDSENQMFHALLCARANTGPVDGRGVIGHAQSTDLTYWVIQPPVSEPGDFGMLEVPQLVHINDRYYLLFCTMSSTHSARWRQRTRRQPVIGTHYLVADQPYGTFRLSTDEFLVGDAVGSLYAGKMVLLPMGNWGFMAWRMFASDGVFIGELTDPYPVVVDTEGHLSVVWQG